MKLSTAFPSQLREIVKDARVRVDGRESLAAASQALADVMHSALEESLALTRVFATVPFRLLPDRQQSFVRGLMRERRVEGLLTPQLPVLTLMGTRGARAEWNHRDQSRAHLGIPLASAAFVDSIPMISRMLAEFGVVIEGLEAGGTVVKSRVGTLSAMFYVADARTETDEQGRVVISAQDFVEEQGVKTVFGFGGAYMLEKSYLAIIFFAKETVEADLARELAPLSSALKAATMRLVEQGRFF